MRPGIHLMQSRISISIPTGLLGAILASGAACSGDQTPPSAIVTPPVVVPTGQVNKGCAGAVTIAPSFVTAPGAIASSTATLSTVARGNFRPARFTGEIAVPGNVAYTTTWGNSSASGSAIYVWDLSGSAPPLGDSISVTFATTLGDAASTCAGPSLLGAP